MGVQCLQCLQDADCVSMGVQCLSASVSSAQDADCVSMGVQCLQDADYLITFDELNDAEDPASSKNSGILLIGLK